VVRAIPAPGAGDTQARSFFDKMNDWARSEGAPGLGYIIFCGGEAKGPIAKFLDDDRLALLKSLTGIKDGDGVFFACDKSKEAAHLAGKARIQVGNELDLIEKDAFRFCWVVDYPMFEMDENTGKIQFSHNPFSMPQGGMSALESHDPLNVLAYQYDIVCNGIELCSGAIRNHLPDIMYKAFAIAGFSKKELEAEFGGMIRAMKFGAPPHGGCAPGVDRMVMLLADEPNIREVVAFPMNQQAQDLLMGAPGDVSKEHLQEVHIRIVEPPKQDKS
jgi:Aspartyl-tRNA synthetase